MQLGQQHTPESKEKMRRAHLGKRLSKEHRRAISDAMVQRSLEAEVYRGARKH